MDKKTKDYLKTFNNQLGGFGRYQKFLFILTCCVVVFCGVNVLNYVFIVYEVPYRCAIPVCENPLNSSIVEDFLNFTSPIDDKSLKTSSCYAFKRTNNDSSSCTENDFDSSTTEECSQWIYDKSLFKSTVVSEFDLTCERSWLQAVASSAYMFGMPFGALFLGDLGDRIGRKKGIMVAIIIAVFGEFTATFSVNFYMYFAMRFLSGVGSAAAYPIAMIQALEVVQPDKRTFCGIIMKIPFSIAQASPAVVAYFIRNWRQLQLTLSLPFFLLLSYWWIMPESILWLLSKGKYEEARIAMQKAAAMNRVEISQDVYDNLCTSKKDVENTVEIPKRSQRSSFDLFKTPRLRNRTLILIVLWIITIHAHYNSALNTAYFGGTIFTSFFFVMLVDIPSNLFAYFILSRWGRKGTLVFLLFVGGLAGISSSFIQKDMTVVLISLNVISKFCAAAAVSTIYIFTIEVFSTQYRSLGLGLCSMSSRIGGILAPFTSRLAIVYKPLPLIVTGILCFIGGVLSLFLPETLGQELPQTLQESEDYGEDQKMLDFVCCSGKGKITNDKQ